MSIYFSFAARVRNRAALDARVLFTAVEIHVFLPVFVSFVVVADAAALKLLLDGVNEVPEVGVVSVALDRHVHQFLGAQAAGEVTRVWVEVEDKQRNGDQDFQDENHRQQDVELVGWTER